MIKISKEFLIFEKNKINTLDLNKAIEISSYPQYNRDFIKKFLYDNFSNNDITEVFLVSDDGKKIFVIEYSLEIEFNGKKFKVYILVYLPVLYPNYPPEFYIERNTDLGLNKYYSNDKINEEDLRINLNFFGNFNPVENNIMEIIDNLLISFSQEFPVYKTKIKKYNINNKYKCFLDKEKANKILFPKKIQHNQKNEIYISQINELKRQLTEEKEKNRKLSEENNNLKNKINNLNDNINKYEEKIKLLEKELNNIRIEFQKYEYYNNNNIERGITSIKPGETIICVNFVSLGIQDIGNYGLVCKNTDLFVRLEERLYNDFPQFKNYETYFELKTNRIKRFKTLDENNIKNKDIINVFIIDN